MRAFRPVYTFLFTLLTPIFVLRLVLKSLKQPAYRYRLLERFGYYKDAFQPVDIWLHAVSFGEVEVARQLIDLMLDAHFKVCVTTTTPTGSKRLLDLYGEKVSHVYLPYELPFVIRRFLGIFNPKIAVVMETEIWPNLYHEVSKQAIPLMIANGRLSPRSLKGYQNIRALIRPMMESVTLILAQTSEDKARFCELGAKALLVKVAGNIKFDMGEEEKLASQGKAYKKSLEGRSVLIAASTHPGEEEIVLEAFIDVKKTAPDALLILAPRHPERVKDILKEVEKKGLTVQKRSTSPDMPKTSDVYLIDTLGELKIFYYVADVAFVGGSLVNQGGHNVLEAIVADIPVIVGPHMFNFAEIDNKLVEAKGLRRVNTAKELAKTQLVLLKDESQRISLTSAARRVLLENRGALVRHWDEIKKILSK